MRTVIVTGASRGIGAAVAKRFAAEGDKVIGLARSSRGGKYIPLDVSEPAAVMAFFKRLRDANTTPNVLVNCAAADPCVAPADQLDEEDWYRVMRTDLDGTFAMCKYARRAGVTSIVNFTSIHALATYPGRAAYAAAKAGVLGLTRALALDWAAAGVRVNAIAPGPVDGERLRALGPDEEALLARTPTLQLTTEEELADAVMFLAGARNITGQCLVVDGGWTASAWYKSHRDPGML